MQFTQIVVTDEQALIARAAIDLILADPERFVMTEEEEHAYKQFAVFLGEVATNPSHFPVTGRMAATVKRMTRRAVKGEARPPARPNKRKARQERRTRTHKARRKQRQQFAVDFNAAREKIEADMREMEEAYATRRRELEGQPTFDIIGPDGNVVMAEVPESALRPHTGLAEPRDLNEVHEYTAEPVNPPKLHLPGKVEKQMERDAV